MNKFSDVYYGHLLMYCFKYFRRRLQRILLFLCALAIALLASHPRLPWLGSAAAIAQAQNPIQLVQTGDDSYQQGAYREAIALWRQALDAYVSEDLAERALVNEKLARAHQQLGETAIAIGHWASAAAAYQATGQRQQFGRTLTEQAQVFISQGQYQRASALLCGTNPVIETTNSPEQTISVLCEGGAYVIAQETNDTPGQAAALGVLAEANRFVGNYDEAVNLLNVGLDLIQAYGIVQFEAPMRNSLGSIYMRQSQIALRRINAAESLNLNENIVTDLQAEADKAQSQALENFSMAINVANENDDFATELTAQLNELLIAQQEDNSARLLIPIRQRLSQLIEQLPPTRETAYAAITLATSYQPAGRGFSCDRYQAFPQQQRELEKGLKLAQNIDDARAQSFALGELGHLEECRGHLEKATELTHQAQLAASQSLESADSLYLWEWQMGRLYRKQDNAERAEQAYQQAIATLETIRTDILTADRELQFDFRATVEPIYRQYIELQLRTPSETANNSAVSKSLIDLSNTQVQETLQTIDALRLAELQNFFGNDCILTPSTDAPTRLLENDPHTAVISSIVLPAKVALVARFPNGTFQTVQIENEAVANLQDKADEFRRLLKRYANKTYDQTAAQSLYQTLISPFEGALENAEISTLVFVQDGFLRNIPMAALHSGEHYLIERYAVATSPALSLTAPQPSRRPVPRALAVGLSKETMLENGQSFAALNSVKPELASVSEQLPTSRILLDQEFTTENLTAALEEDAYSILHLATHGQFSTIPEETFVVTGPDHFGTAGKLTFGQLEALIRKASPNNTAPIDLIALTACETATGDERATLGLAGVAIRAGARSAIASLWKVDDAAAAKLMGDFYSYLKQENLSKAQALQRAQIEAIAENTAHPGRWAPLILVGNWQ